MKLFKTILLLGLIAVFIQMFLLYEELHNEVSVALVVPITINVLLILIHFFHSENSTYRKGIKIILISCLVVSTVYFGFVWYIVQFARAFKN
jgi:hypothetical protein